MSDIKFYQKVDRSLPPVKWRKKETQRQTEDTTPPRKWGNQGEMLEKLEKDEEKERKEQREQIQKKQTRKRKS